MLQIVINILLVVHVLASFLLLLVVLMQRPKSEGLGAAFGGGMTEDLFGAQTTTVLTKATVYLGITFFVLTLTLSVLYSAQSRQKTGLQIELSKPAGEEPAASAATLGADKSDGESVGKNAADAAAAGDAEAVEVVDNALDETLSGQSAAQDKSQASVPGSPSSQGADGSAATSETSTKAGEATPPSREQ